MRLRVALAPLRRRWWFGALVLLLVAAGSLWQYIGPGAAQHVYLVRQAYQIVVLPAGSSTTYSDYLAQQQEAAIARAMTSGGLLTSPTLDTAILARASHYLPYPYNADSSLAASSAASVGAALSATHSGSAVVITARWPSATVAAALARGAHDVLTSGNFTTLLAGVSLPAISPSSATISLDAQNEASQPTLDADAEAAARQTLITRLVLGLLAGLALAYGADWLVYRMPASAELGISAR